MLHLNKYSKYLVQITLCITYVFAGNSITGFVYDEYRSPLNNVNIYVNVSVNLYVNVHLKVNVDVHANVNVYVHFLFILFANKILK